MSFRANAGDLYDTYHEDGLMVIEVLYETEDGSSPTQDDLVEWAAGHHYAAVADPGKTVSYSGYVGGSIPAMAIMKPGGELTMVNGYASEADIVAALP